LELRGAGCISILPPSKHPTTGQYHWIYSPQDIEVAIAPKWIAQLMEFEKKPLTTTTKTKQATRTIHRQPQERSPSISIEEARLLLEVLPPSLAENYHTWLKVGMGLHYVASELLSDWDSWSQSSPKYRLGECEYLWSKFTIKANGITHKTLFWLANKNSF